MLVNRRGLITGLTSLLATPAIVRIQNIMPVRSIKLIDLTDYIGKEYTIDILYKVFTIRPEWVSMSNDTFIKHLRD